MTVEVLNQEEVITPELDIDPEVEKAQAGGWKPQEEWEGNPEDWVDAKQFNKNGEYIDHIKSLSSDHKKSQKQIAKLERELSILAEHHSKVAKIEYEKAMKDLKDLKKEALANLDADRVMEIDDRIEELRESRIQEPKAQRQEPQSYNDVVNTWVESNPWYNSDQILRAAANGLVQEILAQDPDRKQDIDGVLEEVSKQLKVEFPNKFGTQRTRTTSSVIEPGNDGKKQTTSYSRRLTAEQRRFAQRFVDRGAIASIEEYAKQMHDIGELK